MKNLFTRNKMKEQEKKQMTLEERVAKLERIVTNQSVFLHRSLTAILEESLKAGLITILPPEEIEQTELPQETHQEKSDSRVDPLSAS